MSDRTLDRQVSLYQYLDSIETTKNPSLQPLVSLLVSTALSSTLLSSTRSFSLVEACLSLAKEMLGLEIATGDSSVAKGVLTGVVERCDGYAGVWEMYARDGASAYLDNVLQNAGM